MGWYKIECMHGPGHQSTDIWYIEAENRKEAVSNAEYDVDQYQWDWPTWTVKKVRTFPRAELERLLHKKAEHLEDLENEIKGTRRQIRELKSFRKNAKGPHPEDVRYVKCSQAKPKHSCIKGPTDKCRVSKGECGDKGWPYKKLFTGMCMDCKYGTIHLKKKKKRKSRVH